MAATRSLANPPIREAIIEVKSELCDFAKVTAFRDRIADRFPIAKPFRLASLAFQLPDERAHTSVERSTPQQVGWRCEAADGSEAVLVRTDGFSLARLVDYPGWEGFSDRFFDLWDEYRSIVAPSEIHGLGLRYINDIRLPISESFSFDDYLTSTPRTPAGLPQAFVDFLVQMTIPSGADGTTVNVTQATDSNARSSSTLPVIIDIDVCSERIYPADGSLRQRLQSALADMREVKNRVFFGLITDTLAASYA